MAPPCHAFVPILLYYLEMLLPQVLYENLKERKQIKGHFTDTKKEQGKDVS